MASVYTTSRGKNKKSKLGMRKDAANNAANKLSQKIFSADPLAEFNARDFAPKTLGNSATNRKREALEEARAKLNLLLTGSCGNKDCTNAASRDPSKQLLVCTACKSRAYCDAACQKADWKDHKAACKEAKAKLEQAKTDEANGGKSKETKETKEEAAAASSSSSSAAAPTSAAATPTAAAEKAAESTPAAQPASVPTTAPTTAPDALD